MDAPDSAPEACVLALRFPARNTAELVIGRNHKSQVFTISIGQAKSLNADLAKFIATYQE